MEQGAELFFEGLRKEMEPALDELLGMADEFGPAMQSFFARDGPRAWRNWRLRSRIGALMKPPEILPNGDIIIRKKPIAGSARA